MSNSIENYIKVYENIISDDLCDKIISEYENSDKWGISEISNGINTNIRNCNILGMSSESTINQNKNIRKKIDDEVYSVISKIINRLNESYTHLSLSKDSGYDLLKYKKGQFYTEHVDSSVRNPRTISCSLCLNDDYEGGEFSFFDRKIKYKLKKGSAIVFPSNFMYPHQILPVIKGTRYSIITWFN